MFFGFVSSEFKEVLKFRHPLEDFYFTGRIFFKRLHVGPGSTHGHLPGSLMAAVHSKKFENWMC